MDVEKTVLERQAEEVYFREEPYEWLRGCFRDATRRKKHMRAVLNGAAIDDTVAGDIVSKIRGLSTKIEPDFHAFYPEILTSFSTGHRENLDAESAGPGLMVAAATIDFLYEKGYPCFSDMMTPVGICWKEYMLRIVEAKVMIVFVTEGLLRSIHCLREVAMAIAHNVELIPIRCDERSFNGIDIARDQDAMLPDEELEKLAATVNKNYESMMADLKLQRLNARKKLSCIGYLSLSEPILTDELLKRLEQLAPRKNGGNQTCSSETPPEVGTNGNTIMSSGFSKKAIFSVEEQTQPGPCKVAECNTQAFEGCDHALDCTQVTGQCDVIKEHSSKAKEELTSTQLEKDATSLAVVIRPCTSNKLVGDKVETLTQQELSKSEECVSIEGLTHKSLPECDPELDNLQEEAQCHVPKAFFDAREIDRKNLLIKVLAATTVVVVIGIAVIVPVLTCITQDDASDNIAWNRTESTTSGSPTSAPTASIPLPDGPWYQLGQTLGGNTTGDRFGQSVSLSRDGSVMAVGAAQTNSSYPGYVLVFRLGASTWSWIQMGQLLSGEAIDDEFGFSVSLSGNGTILAIGAHRNDAGGQNAGHVRVFQYDGTTDLWIQLGNDIVGEKSLDLSGESVSLSEEGHVVAVGAKLSDTRNGDDSGAVRVFCYNGNSQSWQQKGQTLVGEATEAHFGHSVSLSSSGTIVGVGAYGSNMGTGRALAYQYNSAASTWVPLGSPISGRVVAGWFGLSVSMSDNGLVMAVGSPGSDESVVGEVSVFDCHTVRSTWVQRGQSLTSKVHGDDFGRSVSLSHDGYKLAVGIPLSRGRLGFYASGHAMVLQYNTTTNLWKQVGEPLSGVSANHMMGWSVSLSGNGTVVGIGVASGSATVFTLN